jgi:hypothetical protein
VRSIQGSLDRMGAVGLGLVSPKTTDELRHSSSSAKASEEVSYASCRDDMVLSVANERTGGGNGSTLSEATCRGKSRGALCEVFVGEEAVGRAPESGE